MPTQVTRVTPIPDWFPIIFGPLLVGGVLSGCLTAFMRRWSVKLDFVDHPGGHKGHAQPVALGGGIAVCATFVGCLLAGLATAYWVSVAPPDWAPSILLTHAEGILAKGPTALAICAAALVLCMVGALDDRRSLSIGVRLSVQLLVALMLTLVFDLRVMTHWPLPLSAGISALWILMLINSINFLDNMDGLAAGVAAIAAAVFATAAALSGQLFVPACGWLLVGALLGFLPFNFHPAKIYLGDAGSTVVGLLLAVITILTTFTHPAQGDQPFAVIAPLLVMAVPIYDTASVFWLRRRAGVPIWAGDRRHFSHRLVQRGMSIPRAVLVIWLTTLVTALPTLLLPRASWQMAALIVMQTMLVVMLLALIESSRKHESA